MLEESEVFESRVRQRAFHLWQEAGCPDNTAEEFWRRARAIEMNELSLKPNDIKRINDKDSALSGAADFA